MAESHPNYGSVTYWDERYGTLGSTEYEWYLPYSMLKPVLQPLMRKEPEYEILVVGSGTSMVGPCLVRDGYEAVSNLDSSAVVVEAMRSKHAEAFPSMDWACVDLVQPADGFVVEAFDLAIDKACTDALLCARGGTERASKAIANIYTSLKPGGHYVIVSHAAPADRRALLQAAAGDDEWASISQSKVSAPSGQAYFVYVCRK